MPTRLCAILIAALPLLGVLVWSPNAFATLLMSGTPALLTVAGCLGWGTLVLRWVGLTDPGQQTVTALAFGAGLVGHLALGLALAGWLNQPTAAVLVVAGLLLGIQYIGKQEPLAPADTGSTWRRDIALGIGIAWPLGVLLFAASLPPQTFWVPEARGYDVLEYHLQGPREWYQAGQMIFLPHNVYTTFPAQAEILYLLLMHLIADPDLAAVASQILHALLSVGAVAAIAAFAPSGWGRWVVALAVGTVPWLVVVGSLAYVEGTLLLFAAVGGGLLLRSENRFAYVALSGVLVGFAGGCKYTALVLVATALPLGWLLLGQGSLLQRGRSFLIVGLVSAATFAPWALRNAVWTGNPVYPFAYSVFGGAAWSTDQDAQWARGHRVDLGFVDRLALAERELVGFGAGAPTPFAGALLVGLLAALAVRTPAGRSAVAWLALMLVTWGTMTHMPGRFLIVALVPIGLALGESLAPPRFGWRAVLLGGALLSGATGWFVTGKLLHESDGFWRRRGIDPAHLAGRPEDFRAAHLLNGLPADARLWMVGDAAVFYVDRPMHYTVVFGRDPWLTYAESAPRSPVELVGWLRERGWTHVVVKWPDVLRLRDTYGFPAIVQPEWFRTLEREGGLMPVLPEAIEGGFQVWQVP